MGEYVIIVDMKNAKDVSGRRLTITGILYGVAGIVFLIYIIFYTDVFDVATGYPGAHFSVYTEGWKNEKNEPVDLSKISKDANGAASIKIRQTIPQGIRYGEALNICSHNLFFDVYVDGRCIYRYEPRENLTGYGTGDIFHSLMISPEDAGKEILMEVELGYAAENGGRFSEMILCDPQTFDHLIFRKHAFAFVLSGLILFLGIAVLVIYIGIHRDRSFAYDLFSLGIAVMLIGGWTMIETGIPSMLLGMTDALRVLDYFMLIFMIYPIACFVNSITKQKKSFYPRFIFVLMMLTITGALIGRLGFGMDLHNMMGVFMTYYAISIMLVGSILLQNRRYCKRQGISEGLKYFYIGAGFLLTGGMIDVLSYVLHGKAKANNGNFLCVGLAIFIVAIILQIVQYYITETIRKQVKERKLINYSYYDELTGVKNRRALHEFETTILDVSKPYGYLMCDINGLKHENDTLGHEEGDRLIRDIADALGEVYGKDHVYRVGGDEFAVYVINETEGEFRRLIGKLREKISEKDRSASLGDVFCPEGEEDFESVKNEADKRMYEEKKRHYEELRSK
ncbi:MAG: GGDEF domain-containing protein [Lachnospiraceae bacterium]|nr:GGDEF domain-containing protein [Lachnospiraceae bacterium]